MYIILHTCLVVHHHYITSRCALPVCCSGSAIELYAPRVHEDGCTHIISWSPPDTGAARERERGGDDDVYARCCS